MTVKSQRSNLTLMKTRMKNLVQSIHKRRSRKLLRLKLDFKRSKTREPKKLLLRLSL